MAENIKILADRQDIVAVADAVRSKTGTTTGMTLGGMVSAINSIRTGTTLPELSDEGSSADLMSGKELIGSDGEVVTGTFTIDSELTTQDNLISQIQTALQGKAAGGSAPVLQEKTVSPTTSKQTVKPDSGYDGLSQVTVNAMATGSAKTPATTITKNPTISVDSAGKITASVSGTQSVTPTVTAGYVSSGTAGTITVSGSATKQLTTKAATTYTPSTSNQTIASGTYLTGTQTIKGDSNLKAENIKSGVSIFGVTGTASGSEDLDTELTAQENLISQLSTILDSKAAGGGGSVETYTVTIIYEWDPFTIDDWVMDEYAVVVYTNEHNQVVSLPYNDSSWTREEGGWATTYQNTFTVVKDTLMYFTYAVAGAEGDCETPVEPPYGGFNLLVPHGDVTVYG